MKKVAYKPIGIALGMTGGFLAGLVFNKVWGLLSSREEAPDPTDADATWSEVLLAAALQGAIFATVRAAISRGGASGYRRLTGTWPGN